MIEITIVKHKPTRRIILEAKGHAETAPSGQDLLCAAVSSQMLGFSKAVSAMDERKILGGKISVNFGDGVVDVTMATAKAYRAVERYLTPVEFALRAYEAAFPDQIRIDN